LKVIMVAALALGLTVGGSDFQEAFKRAKHYADDPKVRLYMDTTFLPKINQQLGNVVAACAKKLDLKGDKYEFTVVISYRDGKPDRILLDQETPVGRCAAEGLTAAEYPDNPPYPDLAEDLEITLNLKNGPPPGSPGS
jgi:hypothetical protein